MVDDLSAQLEAQKQRVQELEAQLAEKDIVIAQQGEAITSLNENVNTLAEENKDQDSDRDRARTSNSIRHGMCSVRNPS